MAPVSAVRMFTAVVLLVTLLVDLSTQQYAWRPQGRFGKRGQMLDGAAADTLAELSKRWRPQGRFGERRLEVPDGTPSEGMEKLLNEMQ